MSWREHLALGVSSFHENKLDLAIEHLSKAIEEAKHVPVRHSLRLYDSRAAVYERLGQTRYALRDSRKVIDYAPDHWQGYARSARLFFELKKFTSALAMVELALERTKDNPLKHAARRAALKELRDSIHQAQDKSRLAIESTTEQSHDLAQEKVNYLEKLPIELISHIFVCAVSDSPVTPIILSHVSRPWRSLVLSLPSLWHVLVLSTVRPVKKARLWAIRSANRLSELSFSKDLNDYDNKYFHEGEDLRRGILRALRGLQWERLKILRLGFVSIPMEGFWREIGQADIWWHVEELELTGRDADEWPWSSLVTGSDGRSFTEHPTMQAQSKLRSLTLRNVRCLWKHMASAIHSLVSIRIYDHFREHDCRPLRQVMQANPNLEELICYCRPILIPTRDLPTTAIPPLTLNRLQHLELAYTMPARIMVEGLSLPSLRILRLTGVSDASHVLQSIVENPQSSLAALIELTIGRFSLEPQLIIRALLQAPQLETLQLTQTAIAVNEVVEVLTTPATSHNEYSADPTSSSVASPPLVCPVLRTVDFSGCHGLSSGPLVRMVSARLALSASGPKAGSADERLLQDVGPSTEADLTLEALSVSRIQTLIVNECPRVEADVLPWLRGNVPRFSCRYMKKKAASWKR